MAGDPVAETIASLSAAERARLCMEADQITGLSARRAEEEKRKERLRKKIARFPRPAMEGGACSTRTGEDAIIEAIERGTASEVSNYWHSVQQTLEKHRADNMMPVRKEDAVCELEKKYLCVIEAKLALAPAQEVMDAFRARYGPRENEWLSGLQQSDPARAGEYLQARRQLAHTLDMIAAEAKAISKLQQEIERDIQQLAAQEDKLLSRLAQVMRPLARGKRAVLERQFADKVRPQPLDKRVALLAQIVEQLERHIQKPA